MNDLPDRKKKAAVSDGVYPVAGIRPETWKGDRRSQRAWHATRDKYETWETLASPGNGYGQSTETEMSRWGQGSQTDHSSLDAGEPRTCPRYPAGAAKGFGAINESGDRTYAEKRD